MESNITPSPTPMSVRGVITATTKSGQKLRLLYKEFPDSTSLVALSNEGRPSVLKVPIEDLEVTAELVAYLDSPETCMHRACDWSHLERRAVPITLPILSVATEGVQNEAAAAISEPMGTPAPIVIEAAAQNVESLAPAAEPTVVEAEISQPAASAEEAITVVIPTTAQTVETPVETVVVPAAEAFKHGTIREALKFAYHSMDENALAVIVCPDSESYQLLTDLFDSSGVPYIDGIKRMKPGHIALVIAKTVERPAEVTPEHILLLAA